MRLVILRQGHRGGLADLAQNAWDLAASQSKGLVRLSFHLWFSNCVCVLNADLTSELDRRRVIFSLFFYAWIRCGQARSVAHGRLVKLGWRVGIGLDGGLWVHIDELVVLGHAVGAADHILGVPFGFFGHFPDAEPTHVIVTASADQDVVEVPETDGAAILELVGLLGVVSVEALHVLLRNISLDSHLVAGANFGNIVLRGAGLVGDWNVVFENLVEGNLSFS